MDEYDHNAPPLSSAQHSALIVRSHFSLIWVIPIIAAVVTGWLGLRSWESYGPTITISFENAQGLEAGRTKIRHKSAEIGMVEKLEVAPDLSHVIVTARMSSVAEPYIKKNSRFWVVRPQLSAEGVSSLEPLISGSYIEFEPGDGALATHFIGEESPHLITPNGAGNTYTLHTEQLSAISQGTPVYFHGIKVGEVTGYELSDTDGSADVHIFIYAPHTQLVHTGTRFWNASGITVQAGSSGVKVQLESFQTLLTGGIAFDVPADGKPGAVADANSRFTLFPDVSAAQDSVYTRKIPFLLHFMEPVPGLTPGAQVRMQGIGIGQVTSVNIEYDSHTNRFVVPVIIEIEAERLSLHHHEDSPSAYKANVYADFRNFIAHGLRARLGTGNMLTGQKIVNLDLVPDAPPAELATKSDYPQIPIVEAQDIDSAMRSANEVLSGLKVMVSNLNKIVGSPELTQSVHSLQESLANLNTITHETSARIGPLLDSLQAAAHSADAALAQADKAFGAADGGGDLAGTLRELKNAARSIRVLTDYLETHPEALLKGKQGGAAK